MILYSKLKKPSDYSYKVILICLSYISCCLKSLNQKELSQRVGHVLGSFKRAWMARLCYSVQFFFFVFFYPKWQKHIILSKPFIEEIL